MNTNFFKVNALGPAGHSAKSIEGAPRGKGRGRALLASRRTARPLPRSNYKLFNCSNFTLLELELPRLLAPDLPSDGSSLKDLKWTHSNYRASKESCIFRHYLPRSGVGNLRGLLPSLDVVAVSQAPSPESNPDSPSPVVTMVGTATTIES